MAFIAFTEEEKTTAMEVDIVTYLQTRGETIHREGSEYSWQAPTGKVSIKGNKWYSQYEQVGGSTVSFVCKYFGMSYPEAMKSILEIAPVQMPGSPRLLRKVAEKKEFALPEKHTDMRKAYAYLVKDRLINREIVHNFASRGLIYEDSKHNVVFVGCDEEGTPRHAQKRATNPVSSFKQNVAESVAEYSFHHVGTSERLYVFEAPIDMLAYITMNRNGWADHSYVALASTADRAAIQMLRSYKYISTVYLCLDHDIAGIEGGYRVADSIHELGDYAIWRLFPKNKDWDEDLKEKNGIEPIPATQHPKIKYVAQRCAELVAIQPEKDYIYQVLSRAKGYLIDDAFEKLRLLMEKVEQVEQPKQKEQQLINMAKVTLACCNLRMKQFGHAGQWVDLITSMQEMYHPHHDVGNSDTQISALRKGLLTFEAAIKKCNSVTEREINAQNDAMLRLGVHCISAACAVHIEAEQTENKTMILQ